MNYCHSRWTWYRDAGFIWRREWWRDWQEIYPDHETKPWRYGR